MKQFRKILSLVLVFSLVVTVFVTGVPVMAASSGTADNISWQIDDAGVLTITGTGAMPNFGYRNAPWYDNEGTVKSAVVGEGITTIGEGAFGNCYMMTTVELPETLTSINKDGFAGCNRLVGVDIPDTVTYIGDNAFGSCWTMTSVTIPAGASLGYQVFGGCSALTSIYAGEVTDKIPAGTTVTIGNNAFQPLTSVKTLEISELTTVIGDMAFNGCIQLTSFDIPDSVTSIGNSAFSGLGEIKEIVLPERLQTIGSQAFWNTGLTEVQIPVSVSTIGGGAFTSGPDFVVIGYTGSTAESFAKSNGNTFRPLGGVKGVCGDDLIWTLSEDGVLTISGTGDMYDFTSGTSTPWATYSGSIKSLVVAEGVTGIGNNAFYNVTSLESISLPSTLKTIRANAFVHCTGLTEVQIPAGCELINAPFQACYSLASLKLGSGVSLQSGAFSGCTSLTTVIAENSNYELPEGDIAFQGGAFSGCQNLETVEIPEGVTIIDAAFSGCSALTSVTMPDSVTTITNGAFSGCSALTSVDISNGLKTIGPGAFSGCSSLSNIDIPNGVTTIGTGSFSGCTSLESLIIPNSVTTIDSGAFNGCNMLSHVTISKNVKTIRSGAFSSAPSDRTYVILESDIVIEENSIDEGPSITIYGYTGSTAETFANSNNNTFIALDTASYSVRMRSSTGSESYTEVEETEDATVNLSKVPAPEATTNALFTGWYKTSRAAEENDSTGAYENEVNLADFISGVEDGELVVSLYAGWLDIESVAKDTKDTNIYGTEELDAMTLEGIQLREADNKTLTHDALRFITIYSNEMIADIEAMSTSEIEYGYIVADKSMVESSIGDGEFTIETEGAFQVDCTRNGNPYLDPTLDPDHRNYADYRISSLVITYEEGMHTDKDVLARAYIKYTDVNGNTVIVYDTYTGDSNFGGGCYCSLNSASGLVKASQS